VSKIESTDLTKNAGITVEEFGRMQGVKEKENGLDKVEMFLGTGLGSVEEEAVPERRAVTSNKTHRPKLIEVND